MCTRTTLVVLNLVAELNLDPLTKFSIVYLENRYMATINNKLYYDPET